MDISYYKENTPPSDSSNPVAVEAYRNSLEHLLEELERIDIYIQTELKKIQYNYTTDSHYRGLYISDDDVARHIEKPIGRPWWSVMQVTQDDNQYRSIADTSLCKISKRKEASRKNNICLQFDRLSKIFSLSRIEQDILLLCLAPEIDTKYELIYAYMQDDITKKYITVDLALNILCPSAHDKIRQRELFWLDAALLKHNILEISDSSQNPPAGCFLNKAVRIQSRIVSFLLSEHSTEQDIAPYVKIIPPVNADTVPMHGISRQIMQASLERISKYDNNHIIYICGKNGSGRLDIATAISSHRKMTILRLDIEALQHESDEKSTDIIDKFIREAYLQPADIFLPEPSILVSDKTYPRYKELLSTIQHYRGLVYISGQSSWPLELNSRQKSFTVLEVPDLSEEGRLQLWKESFTPYKVKPANKDLKVIASRFRFTPQQIRESARTAAGLTENVPRAGIKIDRSTLFRACKLNTNRNLATLAQKIKPIYNWDDITLEKDRLQQLSEICDSIKYHHIVYNEWGFSKKLSIGKGTSVLFSGPPGTGKTMAAEIIANNLGLDLYKIDLSLIVSKYIGETEKNLSRIFDEAETSNAVLFFDEADALFGKRTEIKDSHDRYANIEVSYLLQRIEAYEGITILATNLRKNLDDAFLRRLSDIVEFPIPKVTERKQIWTQIWPDQAPLADGIDFDFLASRFKLSGGYIKNIALTASFMAAALGDKIEMRHLLLSTRRELEKQGRTCVKQDFGEYADFFDFQAT